MPERGPWQSPPNQIGCHPDPAKRERDLHFTRTREIHVQVPRAEQLALGNDSPGVIAGIIRAYSVCENAPNYRSVICMVSSIESVGMPVAGPL